MIIVLVGPIVLREGERIGRTELAKSAVSAPIDEALGAKVDCAAPDTDRLKGCGIDKAPGDHCEAVEDHEIALTRRGGASTPLDEAERGLGLR